MSDQLPRDHDSIRLEYLEEENESLKRERAMLVEALHDIEDTRPKGYIDRVAEIAHYALSATSEQSAQWLEEKKAEVLEEAAKLCEESKARIFEFSDEIVKKTANNVLDNIAFSIRRLAASKRKEQV